MANAVGGDVKDPKVRDQQKGGQQPPGKDPQDSKAPLDLDGRVSQLEREVRRLAEQLKAVKDVADKAADDGATALGNTIDLEKRTKVVEDNAEQNRLEVEQLRADHDGLSKALLAANPGAGPAAGGGKWPSFLIIETRQYEFDPIAREALESTARAVLDGVDVAALGTAIVDNGLGSAVARLSQRLGRTRVSEPRRHLLARVYPALLQERLKDPIDPKLLEDTAALAGALLDKLDQGPVDLFADAIVQLSERKMSLQLSDKQKGALKERVRASL